MPIGVLVVNVSSFSYYSAYWTYVLLYQLHVILCVQYNSTCYGGLYHMWCAVTHRVQIVAFSFVNAPLQLSSIHSIDNNNCVSVWFAPSVVIYTGHDIQNRLYRTSYTEQAIQNTIYRTGYTEHDIHNMICSILVSHIMGLDIPNLLVLFVLQLSCLRLQSWRNNLIQLV